MEQKKSLNRRRFGVALTILSLVSIVLIFECGTAKHWNTPLKIAGLIPVLILIVSFIFTFIRTGLWQFTHKSLKNLDEREIALTSKALRYAYAIFVIIVLLLLLSFSVFERPLHIVLVVSLILLAHILPASVIAWTEKQTDNKEQKI